MPGVCVSPGGSLRDCRLVPVCRSVVALLLSIGAVSAFRPLQASTEEATVRSRSRSALLAIVFTLAVAGESRRIHVVPASVSAPLRTVFVLVHRPAIDTPRVPRRRFVGRVPPRPRRVVGALVCHGRPSVLFRPRRSRRPQTTVPQAQSPLSLLGSRSCWLSQMRPVGSR